MTEPSKKKKGVWTPRAQWIRLLEWIARGTKQAEKRGQAPCKS